MLFLLKYWKQLLIFTIVAASISSYTYVIYRQGYNNAEVQYQKRIEEYERNIVAKINDIQTTSFMLYKNYEEMKTKSSKDFKAIIEASKNKPMVVYQDGKCVITPNFTDSFNQAIERANK